MTLDILGETDERSSGRKTRTAEPAHHRTLGDRVQLSVSGLLTTLTGIYFLFLPSGGYQGGRNPHYGQTFLFDRHIWSDIHTWAGIAMIAVSLFHVILHWQWVAEMGRRSLAVARGRRKPFNRRSGPG